MDELLIILLLNIIEMTVFIILSIVIINALITYRAYKVIQKGHYHPEGRWASIKPNNRDVFFVFCPVLNVFVAADRWREKKREVTIFKPRK